MGMGSSTPPALPGVPGASAAPAQQSNAQQMTPQQQQAVQLLLQQFQAMQQPKQGMLPNIQAQGLVPQTQTMQGGAVFNPQKQGY